MPTSAPGSVDGPSPSARITASASQQLGALDPRSRAVGVDRRRVHVEDRARGVAHEVGEQLRPLHRVRVAAQDRRRARPRSTRRRAAAASLRRRRRPRRRGRPPRRCRRSGAARTPSVRRLDGGGQRARRAAGRGRGSRRRRRPPRPTPFWTVRTAAPGQRRGRRERGLEVERLDRDDREVGGRDVGQRSLTRRSGTVRFARRARGASACRHRPRRRAPAEQRDVDAGRGQRPAEERADRARRPTTTTRRGAGGLRLDRQVRVSRRPRRPAR